MELTLDAILPALLSLLGGGSIGIVLTWRWQKVKAQADAQKAQAEAKQQEAEAKAAEVEIAQKVQETYERMIQSKQEEVEDKMRIIQELRMERDHFRQDRNELRERQDKTDATVRNLQREVARYGRMVESMRPFVCGDRSCKLRQSVIISSDGAVEASKSKTIKKGGTPC